MVDLPFWLHRFLEGSAPLEAPAPGVARLWPESDADELQDLVREQQRYKPWRPT